MCGIAGYFGRFDRSLLESMTDILAHRGPDDSGIIQVTDQPVGFGHRRLSIIDLSANGRQPMWDATESALITYNGEIYNYRELRRDLEAKGYVFNSSSDTEVLVNLYLENGEGMLSQLNGIFAFAIWDSRTKRVFLARDGVGVKPLYYSQTKSGFLFASELKALLLSSEVDRTIDPVATYHYLSYLYCPSPMTMLKSVQKLPPGHAMIVEDGTVRRQFQYYDLPYSSSLDATTEGDAKNELKAHLRNAVDRQLVADVEVGAFLSGGLDSSSVVAMAKQAMPDRRIQCFTIRFRGDDPQLLREMGSDLPYAEKVARHLDVDLQCVDVGPELIDDLQAMVYYLDEPQGDVAPLNVYRICQLARQQGIKVLLSGAGGDDILGGYRRHYALMLESYWSWLPRMVRKPLRATAQRVPVSSNLGRRFAKAFLYADETPQRRLSSYFRWARPDVIARLFAPDVRQEIQDACRESIIDRTLQNMDRSIEPLNQMLYLDGKYFLTDHNLNYTDKMSMAAGVETRVPLLDPDLYAFAARLPVKMKQRGNVGKWLFKKAMEEYLPNDVIYRPKVGFGAPVRYWMRNQLRPMIEDLLTLESVSQRGLFDPEGIAWLIEHDRAGRVDASYTILTLLCMEIWCRLFVDAQPIQNPN